MSTKLPRHLLPESLLQIAEHCGDDVMWKIWERYGGGRLYVPDSVTPEHELSQLLGYPDACRFCANFGREQIAIAKADSAKIAVRDALIRQAKQEGVSNLTLARRHNLTDRRIMEICRADAPPSMNFDLFE
jgi:hypothetical protein